MKKPVANSQQPVEGKIPFAFLLRATSYRLQTGFTLIETLVAISILSLSIVAPMSLATQSLVTADYAKDQITAFYLAQEALESVRHLRDTQILRSVNDPENSYSLFGTIPVGQDFIIDTLNDQTWTQTWTNSNGCAVGVLPPLKTTSANSLYSYGSNPCTLNGTDGTPSRFTRTVRATSISGDELRITATVSWKTGGIQTRSFTISNNLFRWAGTAGN